MIHLGNCVAPYNGRTTVLTWLLVCRYHSAGPFLNTTPLGMSIGCPSYITSSIPSPCRIARERYSSSTSISSSQVLERRLPVTSASLCMDLTRNIKDNATANPPKGVANNPMVRFTWIRLAGLLYLLTACKQRYSCVTAMNGFQMQ